MDFSGLDTKVKGTLIYDAPMSQYTTWRIGGKADCLFLPKDGEDIAAALDFAKKRDIPYMVMGNGSNMLVLDGGIRGLVIRIGDDMASYNVRDDLMMEAQSGCILAKIARETARMGLKGLEWAAGIPASLGGAAVMNAGAYGHFFYETLHAVEIIDRDGKRSTLSVDELEYGYRNTSLMRRGAVVTKVYVQMTQDSAEKLTASVEETLKSRRDKQPLELPSAGSVFKNPPGDHAGRLVEASGLRGLTYGGAQVSVKHGNFIVNIKEAKAQDVLI
ncbi:MAG: UDP-N-acetylmuramate dehydrogenase, partial [Bacillota bacterium]|nr:UDP-N-acetylmuramate dehydrogenase [Bacillota bacterium]